MTETWKAAWTERLENHRHELRLLNVFILYCNRFLPHLSTQEKQPIEKERQRVLNVITECERELQRRKRR